jgi:hypothetical protein
VYTIGYVYLPRTGRAYPVLALQVAMSGTIQVEMLWNRAGDDFALELQEPGGGFLSASRSGLKESVRVFLPQGRKATVYMTRYSSPNVAPKLVLRFSRTGVFPGDADEEIAAASPPAALSTPAPTTGPDIVEALQAQAPVPPASKPEALPAAPDEIVAAMEAAPSTPAPAPSQAAPRPTPRLRDAKLRRAPSAKPAASKRSGRDREAAGASRKPTGRRNKPAPASASEPARPRDKDRPQPAPTLLPASARATAAPTPQHGASAQQGPRPEATEAAQPRRGPRISPRGEATHVRLDSDGDRFLGRQSVALELPEARLEITVPRGFDLRVTDEQGRRVSLVKLRELEAWEGISGTEYSFLCDSYGTRPLPSGRYSVEVSGRSGGIRFRSRSGSVQDRELASRYTSQLVLIKRQY